MEEVKKHIERVPWYLIKRHHFVNDALADTIMERNEALYIKIIEASKQLGGEINYLIVSEPFWKDNWEQVWINYVLTPYQQQIKEGDKIKVARFHDKYDIYASDCCGDVKDWIDVVCNEGTAKIIISGFHDEI